MAKHKITSITAIFLVILMVLPLAVNLVQAADTKDTYAFIGAMPNPVGVGQTLILHIGTPDALQKDGDGWTGITVSVIKPDNTTETIGPYKTDSTGSTGALYTPTMAGTYYFQTHFPGQWYNYTGYNYYSGTIITSNVYYKASDSAKLAVTVQEEALPYYPEKALPTEYWTRPINAQFRGWSQISGNWLIPTPILPTDNLYAADNQGPESAHILWTRPLGDTMGGLAGGIDETAFGNGDAYEGKFGGQMIIGGVLFYNKYDSNQPQKVVTAVDLHTGKELWTKSLFDGRIAFGQVVRWNSMNYQGDFAYLWVTSGTNWYAFDPLNGDWKFNMTNVPSGTNYYGPKGEILKYSINAQQSRLTQWNSTAAVVKDNVGMAASWGSQVSGKSINATIKGYDLNVTIPAGLPGSVRTILPTDKLVGALVNQRQVTIWALSLKSGQEGTQLYSKTWTPPDTWASGNLTVSWAAASLTDNVAVLWVRETQQYYGFSLTTGEYLWGPTEPQHYLSIFDLVTTINYGHVVSTGCSGITYCYNATTGQLVWSHIAEDPYTEFTIGNNWWMQQHFIADDKVYIGQVEHSANQPLPRGAPFLCIDIATGEVVWEMNLRSTCWGGKAIIGDSIIAMQNTYDQRVYAVGKGPSQTTVTAPATGVFLGNSIVISGTITDISPGTKEYSLTSRFPNGVPAVSDASMSDWMKYVYMQFDRPINTTGVPIQISVLDANDNYRDIGTAISNSEGFFSFDWKPDIEGKYTVYASFAGSKSFYPSHSIAAFVVDQAESTPAPTQAIITSMADTYLLPGIAAIIIAVGIVGAMTMLMLRKRP